MIKFHASSQGGDSGSPIFSGNGAYGILIGGDGTNSYGYSMSKVLNALGATLYTGTGSDV